MKRYLVRPLLGLLVSANNHETLVPEIGRTLEGIQAVIAKKIQPHSHKVISKGKASFLERSATAHDAPLATPEELEETLKVAGPARTFWLEWAFKLRDLVQKAKENGMLSVEDMAVDSLEDDAVFSGTPRMVAFYKMRFKAHKFHKLMSVCDRLKGLLAPDSTDADWTQTKPFLPLLTSIQADVEQTMERIKIDEATNLTLKGFVEIKPRDAAEYEMQQYETAEKEVEELIKKLDGIIQPLFQSSGSSLGQPPPPAGGPNYNFWITWALKHSKSQAALNDPLTKAYIKLAEKFSNGETPDPPSGQIWDELQKLIDDMDQEERDKADSWKKSRSLTHLAFGVPYLDPGRPDADKKSGPEEVDQYAQKIMGDRLGAQGQLSDAKHLENFALAREAVDNALKYKSSGTTDEGWVLMLADKLKKIAPDDPLLFEVLQGFGWMGQEFEGPPDVQKLKEILEMPNLRSIEVAIDQMNTMHHPCVKATFFLRHARPVPFSLDEMFALSANHYLDLRQAISDYLKFADVIIDAKDVVISDVNTAYVKAYTEANNAFRPKEPQQEVSFVCTIVTPEGDVSESSRIRDVLRNAYQESDQGAKKVHHIVQNPQRGPIDLSIASEAVTTELTEAMEDLDKEGEGAPHQCCCPEVVVTRTSPVEETRSVEWVTHDVSRGLKLNSEVKVLESPGVMYQPGTITRIAAGPTYTVKLTNSGNEIQVPETLIKADDESRGVDCESWQLRKSEWTKMPHLRYLKCTAGECPEPDSEAGKILMRKVEGFTSPFKGNGNEQNTTDNAAYNNPQMGNLSAKGATPLQTEMPAFWSPMGVQLPMEGFMVPPNKIVDPMYAQAYTNAYAALARPRLMPVLMR